MEKKKTKKRKGLAITSLILNVFFLIPILNIIFSGLAIIFGIRALSNIKNKPSEYGGKALAIIGVVWGIVIITTTIFSVFYYYLVYKR